MHFLLTFILQLAVILVAARVVGLLFRFIQQPQVVGVAKAWGLSPEFVGNRHERIVSETRCSLLVIRKQTQHH
jgi:hypothetical protein